MPVFVAEEMAENMLLLNKEHGYYGNHPLEESNAVSRPSTFFMAFADFQILSEPATTWEQFLRKEESYKDLQ